MSKYICIWLLICIAIMTIYIIDIFWLTHNNYNNYHKFTINNYNNYQTIQYKNIYIIQSKNKHSIWSLYFDNHGNSASWLNNLYKGSKKCSIVNWWYFGYKWKNNEEYIPIWDISNDWYETILWFHPQNDPNISTQITINNLHKFEAWPNLIDKWKINTWLLADISHRQQQAPRTFIIQRSDWWSDIWIYNKWITLAELSEYIYNLHIYTWDYSVINLDWWSSTSIITPDYEFNENQKLPRFFIICEE